MWDNDFDTALASVWEYLAGQVAPTDSVTIRRQTGLGMSKVVSVLSQLTEVDLLTVCDRQQDLWELKKPITALEWARAVEVGVPLACLEQTMALSVQERKKAEKAISSGQIDDERHQRQRKKIQQRENVIRGRAASRAAATDLAKIVQDAHTALSSRSSKVNDVFREEASKALEALIQAMEKTTRTGKATDTIVHKGE